MRTSTTSRARSAPRETLGGFTLIEILVVVLLIAVTASMAVVALAPDDRGRLRDEAARLAMSFQHAQDEAVMTGRTIAWRGTADGYEYLRRGPDRTWVPVDADAAFRAHRFPAPVRLDDVELGGAKLGPEALVVLSPTAVAPDVRFLLASRDDGLAVEAGSAVRVVPRDDR